MAWFAFQSQGGPVTPAQVAVQKRDPQSNAPPTTRPEPHETSARLRLPPGVTRVSVDGKDAPARDGGITLSGHPGDSFRVQVATATASRELTVTLGRAGVVSPAAIDFPSAPNPVASAKIRRPAPAGGVPEHSNSSRPKPSASNAAPSPVAPNPRPEKASSPVAPNPPSPKASFETPPEQAPSSLDSVVREW